MRDLPAGRVRCGRFLARREAAARDRDSRARALGRLVLGGIGDNVFAPESIAEAAAHALERGATADTPPPVLAFLRTWEPERNDALAIAAVLRRPPNPTFTRSGLGRIAQPVLIVNGDADPVARWQTSRGELRKRDLRDAARRRSLRTARTAGLYPPRGRIPGGGQSVDAPARDTRATT